MEKIFIHLLLICFMLYYYIYIICIIYIIICIIYIISIFQMWMRRMRNIQRTRFSEIFPSTNKRVSCSHLAIFNRFIFEGSSSHSFWTFLGTSSIESNGTRVPFRIWGVNYQPIGSILFSFFCSFGNEGIILF